jgi:hypothetical protein
MATGAPDAARSSMASAMRGTRGMGLHGTFWRWRTQRQAFAPFNGAACLISVNMQERWSPKNEFSIDR